VDADTILHLYQGGAWIPAVILTIYFLMRWASTRFAWLEAPGRAHYVTAVLSVLAVLAPSLAQGTLPTLAQVVGAVAGNMLLFLQGASGTVPSSPAVTPQNAPSAPAPKGTP
jgi:hypothetical protein